MLIEIKPIINNLLRSDIYLIPIGKLTQELKCNI